MCTILLLYLRYVQNVCPRAEDCSVVLDGLNNLNDTFNDVSVIIQKHEISVL